MTMTSSPGGVRGAEAEGSGLASEDLFLHLAQDITTPARKVDLLSGSLVKRVPSTKSNASQGLVTRSASSCRARSSMGNPDVEALVQSTEPFASGQRQTVTASIPQHSPTYTRDTSSGPPDSRFNAFRSRYMALKTPQPSAYQHSMPDGGHGYARPAMYRPSKLNHLSARDMYAGSPLASSNPHRSALLNAQPHDNDADSVVSTAQSTVWDELSELKSRIQRMELTSRTAMADSNGLGERPKTATTTQTSTMSGSPKGLQAGRSPTDSVMGGTAAINAYPVFHQSLARCKEVLESNTYRALETAASDALQLALLTGNGSAATSQGFSAATSVANGGNVIGERQLRRKADSLVRNLQDLCVALCDANNERTRPRTAGSRPATSHGLYSWEAAGTHRNHVSRAPSRARSIEPADEGYDATRLVQSRALDRVEMRRASLAGDTASIDDSPREPPSNFRRHSEIATAGAQATPSQPFSRLPRTGTSLLRSRRAATEEPEDRSPRAVSRAASEIQVIRQKRQNRLSGQFSYLRSPGNGEMIIDASPNKTRMLAADAAPSRRLTGAPLRHDTPRTPSFTSSYNLHQDLGLDRSQKEQTPEWQPETPTAAEEGSSGHRRALRRSLGLYTSSARVSLGLGLGKRGERKSLAASGTRGE